MASERASGGGRVSVTLMSAPNRPWPAMGFKVGAAVQGTIHCDGFDVAGDFRVESVTDNVLVLESDLELLPVLSPRFATPPGPPK